MHFTEGRILQLYMKKAPLDRLVEPACNQVGRASQTTATFIAAFCFFFGIAVAAFAPMSAEARIAIFCFALVLAVGFIISGYVLRQILGLGYKLGDITGAACARLLAPFANEFLYRRTESLENRLVEQSRLLNEGELELKRLRSEIEIARGAEADLRNVLIEVDGRAKADKAKLQAALDRANGERVRLAYDLNNTKRQGHCIGVD
jgi:hypothetical protein